MTEPLRPPTSPPTTAHSPTSESPTAEAPVATELSVKGRDGEVVNFTGYLLASRSSHQDQHRHSGEFAPPGWRCGACRWFQVAIYAVVPPPAPAPAASPVSPVTSAAPVTTPTAVTEAGESNGGGRDRHRHRYMVHTQGCSVVPNEIEFARAAPADTPFKVLELLTQWRNGRATIPETSAQAIDDAADRDAELDDAYEQWLRAGVEL